MTTSQGVPAAPAARDPFAGVQWQDVGAWGVEGKGWTDTLRFYDRLPARAQATVTPDVWTRSRCSAGMAARFETDAREVFARWTLLNEPQGGHLGSPAHCGLDLYLRGPDGRWHWAGSAHASHFPQSAARAHWNDMDPHLREGLLYLPLHNGVEALEIGVRQATTFRPLAPRAARPVVFYGTSIVHGAGASRPGTCHPAILGRWLDRPVLNLGFSSHGRMDLAVAELLAELDPAIYVVDCLPNMGADLVRERTEPLVRTIRRSRPATPIVLVEDRTMPDAVFVAQRREGHRQNRAALRESYQRLVDAGVPALYYVEGDALLGDDGEGTVDPSHPSDLGFLRYAQALAPVLRRLVGVEWQVPSGK